MSILVSVVIINFNSGKYIFDCLSSLFSQTHEHLEIIVIDNKSNDGSEKVLQSSEYCSKIKYIYSDENLGSSRANNKGIDASRGEYILILNADVILDNNFIEECLAGFKIDKKIGTVTGKLLSLQNPSIIDSSVIELYVEGIAADPGMGCVDVGQYDQSRYVVSACCAAAMYKREMLDNIKFEHEYYDEDFFAFYEDLDLSVNSILMGWLIYYNCAAQGQHARGGSTSNMSTFVRSLTSRNIDLLYYKIFRMLGVKTTILYHLFRCLMFMNPQYRQSMKYDIKLRERMKEKNIFFLKKWDVSLLEAYINKSYFLTRVKRINRLIHDTKARKQ